MEIFAILMRIFSTIINSKVESEKELEIILTNKRFCTLKRERNSLNFFLKTDVGINNNLKVIYLVFSIIGYEFRTLKQISCSAWFLKEKSRMKFFPDFSYSFRA